MIISSFISLVIPIARDIDIESVEQTVNWAADLLADTFGDYEIILVDNRSGLDVSKLDIRASHRSFCFVVKLAAEVVWDRCVLAGLERANGDYAYIVDPQVPGFASQLLIVFEQAQRGHDVVYLQSDDGRGAGGVQRRLFFILMRRFGASALDENMLRAVLLSRRAINAVIDRWSATSLLSEAIFNSGFLPSPLSFQLRQRMPRRRRREERMLAWAALSRNTDFPLAVGRAAIGATAAVALGAALNAISVRLFGYNLLLQPEEYVPGWAFVVVLISFLFMFCNLSIYVLLRVSHVSYYERQESRLFVVEHYSRL